MNNWYSLLEPFFTGVGWTMPDVLMAVGVLFGLLFGAADYRIGLMACLMTLIGFAGFFIYYGFDTTRLFLLIFSCMIIMAISLFTENSKAKGGFL
jgi:hypothetical protein